MKNVHSQISIKYTYRLVLALIDDYRTYNLEEPGCGFTGSHLRANILTIASHNFIWSIVDNKCQSNWCIIPYKFHDIFEKYNIKPGDLYIESR